MQRRRIDHGEGSATVLSGASRVLFDIDLDTRQRLSGERPIQLALEGTSPIFLLQDLAIDPKFTGRLLVGVAPDLFFSGFAYRGKVQKYYREETLSQKAGQWLSMHFIEPFFAWYDPDFALMTMLRRQHWLVRSGVPSHTDVRKLIVSDADRNTKPPQIIARDRRCWRSGKQERQTAAALQHDCLYTIRQPPEVTVTIIDPVHEELYGAIDIPSVRGRPGGTHHLPAVVAGSRVGNERVKGGFI